ncbi:uncharacterized protein [Montipora capricornis]|uniref:uncharacterized protein n=1 Tax=Montipora capricornis TaxID=246305 RepID=UPI0035F1B1F5
MEFILCFLLGLFVKLSFVSGSDIYPSIHWVPQNPILQADGNICGAGPRYLKVQLNSKVNFICPNMATVLQKVSTAIQASAMYENLWLLQNETAFEKCDITLDPKRRRLLTCSSPSALIYTSVIFAEFTAEDDGLTFKRGKTYYFIATSDGTEPHLNKTSGGHCMDVSNNIYMKIEVYVCEKGNSTWQDPNCQSDVGYLRCPSVTNVIPSSSRVANPSISSPATTPITEEVSTTASFQSSMSASTSLNVCDQSVITKTISSEVTKSAYCPEISTGSESETVETSSATVSYSKQFQSAVTSTDKSEACATTLTKTVISSIMPADLCKRCIAPSSSTTTSASRVKSIELNRDSSSNGAWKTTAVVVTTLLGLTILVGAIIYVKYRKSSRLGSCHGSTLHEVEYNETEMKSPH